MKGPTFARLMGGNAQGEKKEGLRGSGVLCTGVAMGASGVAGEMGFRFRAFSALRANLFACMGFPDDIVAPKIMLASAEACCIALHESDGARHERSSTVLTPFTSCS